MHNLISKVNLNQGKIRLVLRQLYMRWRIRLSVEIWIIHKYVIGMGNSTEMIKALQKNYEKKKKTESHMGKVIINSANALKMEE